jgi:hypothetical protein
MRIFVAWALATVTLPLFTIGLHPAVRAADVDRPAAIGQAVNYIQQRQATSGGWPDLPGFPGGVTALCTLALLDAGVPVSDDHIQRALKLLRQSQPNRTYTTALTMMVFATADPKGDRQLIERDLKWLETNQYKSDAISGAWGYGQPRGVADNSNTRFALLGLHAAEKAGVKTDPQTWRRVLEYWLVNQNEDGSWGYAPGLFGTGSMTCSGIASVVMAAGHEAHDQKLAERSRKSAERALAWLKQNYAINKNPGLKGVELPWLFYYLNTLEAAGRLTNQARINDHDWFREGSDLVLKRQDRQTGAWSLAENPDEGNPLIATSLALMFLSGKSVPQPPPPAPPPAK